MALETTYDFIPLFRIPDFTVLWHLLFFIQLRFQRCQLHSLCKGLEKHLSRLMSSTYASEIICTQYVCHFCELFSLCLNISKDTSSLAGSCYFWLWIRTFWRLTKPGKILLSTGHLVLNITYSNSLTAAAETGMKLHCQQYLHIVIIVIIFIIVVIIIIIIIIIIIVIICYHREHRSSLFILVQGTKRTKQCWTQNRALPLRQYGLKPRSRNSWECYVELMIDQFKDMFFKRKNSWLSWLHFGLDF